MVKKLFPFLLLTMFVAGCTTTITNLTPKREFRNANGFYPVEAAVTTSQQSLRWSSIKPNVVVGKEFYSMHPTPLMTNRWETLIPIPDNVSVMYYRFKFDYTYNAFGSPPKADSKLSPVYRLQILPAQ
jgi:hypothetical protein